MLLYYNSHVAAYAVEGDSCCCAGNSGSCCYAYSAGYPEYSAEAFLGGSVAAYPADCQPCSCSDWNLAVCSAAGYSSCSCFEAGSDGSFAAVCSDSVL